MSLREKAEAATPGFAAELTWIDSRIGWSEPKVGDFIAAADPPTVLAHLNAERAAVEFIERAGCPCGARGESLDTHPHVIGCPIGVLSDLEHA